MCLDPVTATLIATAASATASVGQGVMGYMASTAEAKRADNEARIAKLEGGWRDLEIKRERDRLHASNMAQMATSGLLVTSGSFESILRANEKTTRRDLANNQFNTNMRVSALRAEAKGHRMAAGFKLAGGLLDAAGTTVGGMNEAGMFKSAPKTAGQSMSSASRQYANSRSQW